MNNKLNLYQLFLAGAMIEDVLGNVPSRSVRQSISKPATMSRKAWKKRKSRLRMTNKSRIAGRA